MSDKSSLKNHIKTKIVLVNNNAPGYSPQKSNYYIDFLIETTQATKVDWSQKERLVSLLTA